MSEELFELKELTSFEVGDIVIPKYSSFFSGLGAYSNIESTYLSYGLEAASLEILSFEFCSIANQIKYVGRVSKTGRTFYLYDSDLTTVELFNLDRVKYDIIKYEEINASKYKQIDRNNEKIALAHEELAQIEREIREAKKKEEPNV